MTRPGHLGASCILALLSACATTHAPDLSSKAGIPVMEAKEGYADPWNDFPGLAELIGKAQSNSPTLYAARARILQAEAAGRISSASALPSVSGTTGRNSQGDDRSGNKTVIDSTGISYQWNTDISGQVREGAKARKTDVAAREDDLENARINLAADIADAYFSLTACRKSEEALGAIAESLGKTNEFAARRVASGIASPQEQNKSMTAYSEGMSAVRAKNTECSSTETKLSVLTGADQEEISARLSDGLPDAIPSIPTGPIPADTVRRRPDVSSAEKAVTSAYHDAVAASRAAYPSLTLSGTLGTGISVINGISTLVRPWTLIGNLAIPLIDAGATQARTDSANAKQEEAFANFIQKVRQATKETEDAMTSFKGAEYRLEMARKSHASAKENLRISKARFDAGIASSDEVEDAFRNERSYDNNETTARQQKIAAQTAIFRATGTGAKQ